MSRIHNTTFNNLAGDTSSGNETQIVTNGTLNAKKKNNGIVILSETQNYLGLSQFETSISTQNNNIQFSSTLGTNQTIFFGVDTYPFIKYLESLFGFSSQINGVTNISTITLLYLPIFVPPVQTITLSSNSTTYNYLIFDPNDGTPPSYKFNIFNGVNTQVINIQANYSSGILQNITFFL